MGNQLLRAFATDNPERFAQLLGASNDFNEAIEILVDIPDGLEGDVVARLAPGTAHRLLAELPDTVVSGWLAASTPGVGRRLLSRLGPERVARVIGGISDRTARRALRRLVDYPLGSIGELVQTGVIAIRDNMSVADISAEFQRHAGEPDAPVVILRADGTVTGVLDLVKFLKNLDPDARAGDFLIPVETAYAEAAQSSLIHRVEWERLTCLPVVDHEQQLIGYVSRTAVEQSQGPDVQSGLFLDSGVELSKRILELMVFVMVMIFGRREQR